MRLLRDGMRSRGRILLFHAIGFGVVAMSTRYLIFDLETRKQIAAFIVIAAVWGWMDRRSGLTGFFINAAVAAAAIIAVRWQLEGLCPGSQVAGCLPATF